MIGRLFDNRYQITDKIGSGGMADVYRADDILLDRIVAVKVLHQEYSKDIEFINRFRREAQAAAKLTHPNIVNIYDVGCDNETYYIVMEYIPGETLKEYISRQGKISNDSAVRIAIEICEALEQAHANGIVHCDIKPHNILITKSGRVKVTDFGIARATNTLSLINKESVLGSVHYFSPEQASGDIVTAQTDIYSLGIVLYEMLTGKVPFEGDSAVSIALKHMQDDIPRASRYNSTITPILEDCIMKSLQKEPRKRFSTISEMIAELRLAQGFVSHKTAKTGRFDFATGTIPIVKSSSTPRFVSNKRGWLEQVLIWPVHKIILGIVILFFIAFGLAFWFFGDFWSARSIEIPNVVGKQIEVAQKILKAEDLNVSVNEISSETIPVGQVISQSPEAGITVKSHRTIHLTISKGGSIILVPDLTGLSIQEATAKLKTIGLRLGKVEEREDLTKPFDKIISQAPLTPTKVEKDSAISVTINKKNIVSRIQTPKFIGLTLEMAEQVLKENELKKGVWRRNDGGSISPKDIVLGQTPNEGNLLARGTEIDLVFGEKQSSSANIKHANVSVQIPADGKPHHTKIIVSDINGSRVVLDREADSGTLIQHDLEGEGAVQIRVLVDDVVVQEQKL